LSFRKLLLFEYVTGGGLCGEPLPASLAAEGDAMLQALLSDCMEAFADSEITVLRDARLPAINKIKQVCVIHVEQDFTLAWMAALERAEAVWIIAPETGGVLQRLVQEAQAAGKRVLNSSAAAIALCSSKLKTAAHLQARGIDAVSAVKYEYAYREHSPLAWMKGPVVVKPDDGAGCLDTFCFASVADVLCSHEIIQPYIAGEPMSLSLWCEQGVATLLSINVQHISKIGAQLKFEGCAVHAVNAANTSPKSLAQFQALSSDIARAIPELWGPVGIDFVMNEKPVVIEINPRMTTSFAKLREVCGINIASLMKMRVSAP
jgi:tyramine---L-glutamate ligase